MREKPADGDHTQAFKDADGEGSIVFDAARLRASRTFREFDDVFTAPLHGFRGVDHYWDSSSSGPYLAHIAVPTLVLNARNDPFLPEDNLLAAARGSALAETSKDER